MFWRPLRSSVPRYDRQLALQSASCFAAIFLGTSLLSAAQTSDHPLTVVAAVAPLYINNAQFSSMLRITNTSDSLVDVMLDFSSLEGDDVGQKQLAVPAQSSVEADVGGIDMKQHRFAAVGSISVLTDFHGAHSIAGGLTIMPRLLTNANYLEEDLQPADAASAVQVAFIPASSSVPVIALRSLTKTPQHVSLRCSDAEGQAYESQLLLPGGMTFLVNACISGKSEGRTYKQLLSGDMGSLKGTRTVEVKSSGQQGSVVAWGFVAVPNASDSVSPLVPIEFIESNPILEVR